MVIKFDPNENLDHEHVVLTLQKLIYKMEVELKEKRTIENDAKKVYDQAKSDSNYVENNLRAICNFLNESIGEDTEIDYLDEVGLK
jgi:uncharacterized protein (UPF0335 family)